MGYAVPKSSELMLTVIDTGFLLVTHHLPLSSSFFYFFLGNLLLSLFFFTTLSHCTSSSHIFLYIEHLSFLATLGDYGPEHLQHREDAQVDERSGVSTP